MFIIDDKNYTSIAPIIKYIRSIIIFYYAAFYKTLRKVGVLSN
jgi:hypothetical protein